MEAADCLNGADRARIESILNGFKVTTKSFGSRNNRRGFLDFEIGQSAPVLYNYASRIHLQDRDWTMEFQRENDPVYQAVMFKGRDDGNGDNQIHEVVDGEILKDIMAENPAVAAVAGGALTRG